MGICGQYMNSDKGKKPGKPGGDLRNKSHDFSNEDSQSIIQNYGTPPVIQKKRNQKRNKDYPEFSDIYEKENDFKKNEPNNFGKNEQGISVKNEQRDFKKNEQDILEKKEQRNFEKNEQSESEINKRSNKRKENKYDDEYDFIIDATSIRDLNKGGWKIFYNNYIKESIEKFSSNIIITVLGNSNRGKTHILQKLSGANIKAGYQIQTKGLSIKKYQGEKLLLDTAGTNAPLLVQEDAQKPTQDEMTNIYLCQIITNYILQTFVIKISNIIICVVGMLTASEQQFINKMKNICKNQKILIVIHNLIKCKTSEEIKKYTEETLFRNITNKLIPYKMTFWEEKYKNLFNLYFIEEPNNNVRHFIYGNDEGKTEEMKYYNMSTLTFINKMIKTEQKQSINIINSLIEHVKDVSSFSLTEELKTITESGDLIKCEEKKIEPKRILADEFDNLIFIGKDFEPKHRCYIKEQKLIVEIDLCSNYQNLKVDLDKNKAKEIAIKISGERIPHNIPNNDTEIILDFIDKRETYKSFELEVIIKTSLFNVLKKTKEELNYGILFLTFDIRRKKRP